jgi:hypothetical protein
MLEEVVVPCWGRKLEDTVMPALRAALFRRDLEALGAVVREAGAGNPALKAEAEKDWQELRNDVLHGQIDYRGDGPLPEHWKQFIDKETNYFDWRHPKWAQDAERLLIDLVVKAAAREGWQGEIHPASKTSAGLVDLLLEVSTALPQAKACPSGSSTTTRTPAATSPRTTRRRCSSSSTPRNTTSNRR